VLVATGRVYECIVTPEETRYLPDIVAEGEYYGMQTFDQALMQLYRDEMVTLEEALKAATSPHDLRVALKKAGVT
jgi:twitching motility protein PilT